MPNLTSLYIRGADHKVLLNVTGFGAFPIKTLKRISWEEAATEEVFFAVGEVEGVAYNTSDFQYSGNMDIQYGELMSIASIVGVTSILYLPFSTLSIASLSNVFNKTFISMKFARISGDIDGKALETPMGLKWGCLSIV